MMLADGDDDLLNCLADGGARSIDDLLAMSSNEWERVIESWSPSTSFCQRSFNRLSSALTKNRAEGDAFTRRVADHLEELVATCVAEAQAAARNAAGADDVAEDGPAQPKRRRGDAKEKDIIATGVVALDHDDDDTDVVIVPRRKGAGGASSSSAAASAAPLRGGGAAGQQQSARAAASAAPSSGAGAAASAAPSSGGSGGQPGAAAASLSSSSAVALAVQPPARPQISTLSAWASPAPRGALVSAMDIAHSQKYVRGGCTGRSARVSIYVSVCAHVWAPNGVQ